MIYINPNENHILVLELSTPLYEVPGKARSIGKVRPRGLVLLIGSRNPSRIIKVGPKDPQMVPHTTSFVIGSPTFFAVGFDDSMIRQW